MLLQLWLALIHVQNGLIAPLAEKSIFNCAIVLLSSETMLIAVLWYEPYIYM